MNSKRKIIVDEQTYIYSVRECDEGIEILVYNDKRLMVWLRQRWGLESWGINFHRPKAVELIIRYYQKKGIQPYLQLLRNEKELFLSLTDLFFDDSEEKAEFIEKCQKP